MLRRAFLAGLVSWQLVAQNSGGIEFFEKKIRPVLAAKCYACHSAAAKPLMGGLLVDSREGIRRGGSSGMPAVVPDKPDQSLLLTAIHQKGTLKMPVGGMLPDEVIADFESWIKMGAPDPRDAKAPPPPPPYDFAKARQHWSYRPVADPAPPEIRDPLWNKNAVDRFIRARLDQEGLTPVAIANKRTLIRRATFDLTGLPPTPEEIDAFLKDDSPEAFAKVVDRLLASPHYGERWGRHWLDVVRYADTAGCNSDFPVPEACRYRNWVIDAFNATSPTTSSSASKSPATCCRPKTTRTGDAQQIIATGYLADLRAGSSSSANEFHLTLEDTIDNLGKALLGLTHQLRPLPRPQVRPDPADGLLRPVRHLREHRYPSPATEIYAAANDFVPLGRPGERRKTLRPTWEQSKMQGRLTPGSEGGVTLERPQGEAPMPRPRVERAAERSAMTLVSEAARRSQTAYAVARGRRPANARMQIKGDPKNLGRSAARVPTVLGGQKLPEREKGSGRRELAEWIDRPGQPADGARDGEPHLAAPFRPGHRADAERLRHARRAADPPGVARLARDAVRRERLVGEGDAPADHAVAAPTRLSRRRRSPTRAAIRRMPSSGRSTAAGSTPRRSATRCWPSAATLDRIARRPAPVPRPHDVALHAAQAVHGRLRLPNQPQRLPDAAAHPAAAVPGHCSTAPTPTPRPAVRSPSTTPLQALFLMNDPFVHEQAKPAPRGCVGEGRDDAAADRSGLPARARPPADRRRRSTRWRRDYLVGRRERHAEAARAIAELAPRPALGESVCVVAACEQRVRVRRLNLRMLIARCPTSSLAPTRPRQCIRSLVGGSTAAARHRLRAARRRDARPRGRPARPETPHFPARPSASSSCS